MAPDHHPQLAASCPRWTLTGISRAPRLLRARFTSTAASASVRLHGGTERPPETVASLRTTTTRRGQLFATCSSRCGPVGPHTLPPPRCHLVLLPLLVQLQSLGVVETMDKGGRRLTKEGQKDLDTIARSLLAEAE